jgi:diguanylate cyclase (GGDEF)-like protein/PAS domain S-box-containing protein
MPDEDHGAFQFLAEYSIDVICRATPDLQLHYVSPSCLQLLGFTPEEMIGRKLDAFVFPEDTSALSGHDDSDSDSDPPPITVRMQKKDGKTVWAEIKLRLLRTSADIGETIIVIHDITEIKNLQAKLRFTESIDASTGLTTPRGFEEALSREWTRALREGSHLALMLLDFNHFRQFHHGRQHREGDVCLAKAATAVMQVLRAIDVAASYGAEDIAVILPLTGSAGAAKVAEKVSSAIQSLRSDPDESGQIEGCVRVRIGIAAVRGHPAATSGMSELLRIAAHNALQGAKRREHDRAIALAGHQEK